MRIGVLNDLSGTYAGLSGPGSVGAAKQAVADFEGTEEDARAAMAAVSTALLSLNQGESAHKVYSQETIDKLTSENKPKDEAAQSGAAEDEQSASDETQATPTYGAQSDI